MVDIQNIEIGDQVKIVDEFDANCKAYGLNKSMYNYLGQIVTVIDRRVYPGYLLAAPDKSYIKIDDDGGIFQWNRWMIDRIVRDEMEDAEIQNEDFSAVLKWGTIE